MKKIFSFLMGLIVIHCLSVTLQAQTSVNSAGGKAVGSGGTATYSLGQVFDKTYSSASGAVLQGVQQPFEVLATSVKNLKSFLQSFNIYPNPVKQTLFLQKKQDDGVKTTYRLLDSQGKELQTGNVNRDLLSIDMKNYSSSVYFIEILQPNKTPQSFKIIKH